MTYYRMSIPLNCLLLDTENARHGQQDDQNAVLKWMASQSKVMNLARSIARHGINPSELPIVVPAGGDHPDLYIVVEGNRRVAVLKMLQDPEKCPDERARKQYRKLRQEAHAILPTELNCIVFPDLQSASHWIQLRHLGEQDGAGTVPWGAKENEFFARRMGQRGPNEPAMKLLEYALTTGLITKEEFDRIPLTNVTRLIKSPDVRREIGMNLRKGELSRVAEAEYFDRVLTGMLKALASPSREWTVSALKNREQRVKFIKDLKHEQGLGSYEIQEETPLVHKVSGAGNEISGLGEPLGINQGQADGRSKRTSRDPLSRKTAISSGTHMKIQNPKMLAIFRELKQINVDQFPNAAAVLTRVFIEGCVDLYIEKHQLAQDNPNLKLAEKVRRVRDHIVTMYGSRPEVKNDLKGLEVFAGSHMSIGSANTFNAIVHNPKFCITSRELKENWNRLESCLPWFEGHI